MKYIHKYIHIYSMQINLFKDFFITKTSLIYFKSSYYYNNKKK